jgi:hypothetical protein
VLAEEVLVAFQGRVDQVVLELRLGGELAGRGEDLAVGEGVLAAAAVEQVLAVAAVEGVVVALPGRGAGVAVADEDVVALAALEDVVAGAAVEEGAAGPRLDGVVAGTAVDRGGDGDVVVRLVDADGVVPAAAFDANGLHGARRLETDPRTIDADVKIVHRAQGVAGSATDHDGVCPGRAVDRPQAVGEANVEQTAGFQGFQREPGAAWVGRSASGLAKEAHASPPLFPGWVASPGFGRPVRRGL